MWIMVAGPYRSGGADAAQRAENPRASNAAALAVLRLGHVPVVGVNMALPVVAAAWDGDAAREEIMMPLSLSLAERCDACLRIGGHSKGAEEEVKRFTAAGRPVFRGVGGIPGAARP
jgi:hypothetical protein